MTTPFEFYPGNHIVSASQATFAEFALTANNVSQTASFVGITQTPIGPKGPNFIFITGSVEIL